MQIQSEKWECTEISLIRIGYAAEICDIPCAISGAPAKLMPKGFLALALADCFT